MDCRPSVMRPINVAGVTEDLLSNTFDSDFALARYNSDGDLVSAMALDGVSITGMDSVKVVGE